MLGGVVHAHRPLVEVDQLRSHEASVEIVANVICVSRNEALKIDNVVAFIRSLDTFHLNRSSDLNALSIRLVNHLVDFDIKRICHLDHLLVELL